jgi:hypothetical protein
MSPSPSDRDWSRRRKAVGTKNRRTPRNARTSWLSGLAAHFWPFPENPGPYEGLGSVRSSEERRKIRLPEDLPRLPRLPRTFLSFSESPGPWEGLGCCRSWEERRKIRLPEDLPRLPRLPRTFLSFSESPGPWEGLGCCRSWEERRKIRLPEDLPRLPRLPRTFLSFSVGLASWAKFTSSLLASRHILPRTAKEASCSRDIPRRPAG